MKGHAFRKLSRSTSHRRALLRNLVTALIQHERISTTVAKAKDAQRVAEKVITRAKRGLNDGRSQQTIKAQAYLFDNNNTMPMLKALAERYKDRQGGYTRLHLHGNRQGDDAPRALLELVDQPLGDLKLEMTAMSMARELYLRASKNGEAALDEELRSVGTTTQPVELDERFQPLTRTNAAKVVKFGGDEARALLLNKARGHFYRFMATRELEGDYRVDEDQPKRLDIHGPRYGRRKSARSEEFIVETVKHKGTRRLAGMRRDVLKSGPLEPVQTRPDRRNSVIRIGKGAFARRQTRRVYMPSAGSVAREVNSAKDAHAQ